MPLARADTDRRRRAVCTQQGAFSKGGRETCELGPLHQEEEIESCLSVRPAVRLKSLFFSPSLLLPHRPIAHAYGRGEGERGGCWLLDNTGNLSPPPPPPPPPSSSSSPLFLPSRAREESEAAAFQDAVVVIVVVVARRGIMDSPLTENGAFQQSQEIIKMPIEKTKNEVRRIEMKSYYAGSPAEKWVLLRTVIRG